jgi:ribosomal protein S14
MKESAEAAARQSSKTRKAPTCRTCGKPRKGHPKGRCLNQPETDNIAV